MAFDFSDLMKDRAEGQLVVPMLKTYLHNAEFPDDFAVHFRKGDQNRPADGWFWPSTHPTLCPGYLYTYLTDPDSLPVEDKEFMNVLALTMGSAVHGFIEMCLRNLGLRTPELNACTMCPPERGCSEPGFKDDKTGSRGHTDGVLDVSSLKPPSHIPDVTAFELKCLAPETPISMADGRIAPASEVSVGDSVVGWHEDDQALRPFRVEDVWDNGIVPVWTISTREGRSIGVTDEHPFLTSSGWVMAKDLEPGDKVRVATGADWWEGTPGDADEAYFLGVMVGDGNLRKDALNLTNVDTGVLSWVDRYVTGLGAEMVPVKGTITWGFRQPHPARQPGGNPVRNLIERAGLKGSGSRDKRVPESVWSGGPAVWAAFLSGYLDADGTVVVNAKGSYPHLSWSSVNRPLLAECQTLLSYLGIRSSLVEVSGRYKGEPHQSWRLLVRDRRAFTRTQEVLTLRSEKSSRLSSVTLTERSDGRYVRRHQQDWDTVSSVSEGLSRPTVGIQMEGGTHVTAGLVTHNTMNSRGIRFLENQDVDRWREKHPVYYAQNQEYMRLSGLRYTIVVVMELGWPWTMREIHVPYDDAAANITRDKYLAVRQAAKEEAPLECCGKSTCPLSAYQKKAKTTSDGGSYLMPAPTRRTA